MPTTTTQAIQPLIIAGLAASVIMLAVAAWKMRKAAQEWRRIAEDAIAANRAREQRAGAAAQTAQTAPDNAATMARMESAINHLRSALEQMQAAGLRYRELAEMLERQLLESRNELEDWQTAVSYHLETIAGLTAERDRMRGQLEALQYMYASRTQAELKAGLTRFVVGDDAGFMR